jgi:hypothetical protein
METSRSTDTEAAQGNGALPPTEPQQVRSTGSGEFNPDDYRYTLASSGPGVRRLLLIPEGRPKNKFFRLDTRPEYRQEVAVYGHKEGFDDEDYLVAPQVQESLGERYVKRAVIRVCVVRPNITRLWAIRYPDNEGRTNTWNSTTWLVAEAAESEWVRFEMNPSGTGWDVVVAETQWPDPEWPVEPMSALIQKAYKGRFINSTDHVILRKLRGEI